jgi:hypothetical protein
MPQTQRTDSIKTFVLLLQGLGLLLTLVSSFLGALYMFSGNIPLAGIISLVFVVAMFYLVTFFMKEKMNRRRKGYPPIFYYMFALYGVLAIALSFFMLHCFNVEFFEKNDAQQYSLKQLEGIELIHNEYDSLSLKFSRKINSEIGLKLTDIKEKTKLGDNSFKPDYNGLLASPYNMNVSKIDFLIGSSDMSNQVVQFVAGNQSKKLKSSQEELFKEGATIISRASYIKDSRNKIQFWNRMKITQLAKEINDRIQNDFNVLNSALGQVSGNQLRLFQISATFDQADYLKGEILLDKPFQLAAKHLGVITPIVLLLFQMLILLPYFLTRGRQY